MVCDEELPPAPVATKERRRTKQCLSEKMLSLHRYMVNLSILGSTLAFLLYLLRTINQRYVPYRLATPVVTFFAAGREARPTLTLPQSWVKGWFVPVGMMDRVNMKRVCIVVGLLTRNMRLGVGKGLFSELASIVEESPNMWGARLSCEAVEFCTAIHAAFTDLRD